MAKSLQETYAPKSCCFGCGPANEKGLHIQSFPADDHVVAAWKPQPHHEAFPGVLNGGIIGTLLDCHSNWTAAWTLMKQQGAKTPPCTVTQEYTIKLLRPTPTEGEITLTASVVSLSSDRATISAVLKAKDKTCATCTGTFVAVKPGHPAYFRW